MTLEASRIEIVISCRRFIAKKDAESPSGEIDSRRPLSSKLSLSALTAKRNAKAGERKREKRKSLHSVGGKKANWEQKESWAADRAVTSRPLPTATSSTK